MDKQNNAEEIIQDSDFMEVGMPMSSNTFSGFPDMEMNMELDFGFNGL